MQDILKKSMDREEFLTLGIKGIIGITILSMLSGKSKALDIYLNGNNIIPTGKIVGYGRALTNTFTNATLSSGILTITHNWALSAPYTVQVYIFDNNSNNVIAPLTGAANSVTVNLVYEGTLSGTWGYLVIG
jgi:hypothetical protein